MYLSGGTSEVALGWRRFTQDVGLRIEADDDIALLRAIAELKERLDVNVETALPAGLALYCSIRTPKRQTSRAGAGFA